MFQKAVKYEAKGRVSLIGPAGSGKSMTMLILARALVGPTGRIACIDTEHGSLSKYAGEPYPMDPTKTFDFDVLELASFSPDAFQNALKGAIDGKYDAFCCDSLSHFWVGKDGALEFVDMAGKRYKDNMGGWKEFRPHERAMVDAMIAAPLHVLTTMRTKTDYQEEVGKDGKKKRVKIGLAPVQREGLEYEFDLVGYMDDDNTLIVDKTRCSAYSKKALTAPSAKDFQPFVDWLKGAAAPVKAAPPPQPPPAVASKPPTKSGEFTISAMTKYDSTKKPGTAVFQVVLTDPKDGAAIIVKTDNASLAATADAALKGKLKANVSYALYADAAVLMSIETIPALVAAAAHADDENGTAIEVDF